VKKLTPVIERISDISAHFSGWLVVIMMGLVLIEVVSRYVVHQPLRVADEFSAYMYVVIVFIGAAYTWKEKGHVSIEVLTSRLPVKAARWLRVITLIGAIVFIPVLIKASYDVVAYSLKFGMRSATWLRVPQGPIQVFLAIGLILLFLQLIVELVRAIQALRASQGETK
jgi:TRAP-type C4-dicarboxylate transport system permease small subunit